MQVGCGVRLKLILGRSLVSGRLDRARGRACGKGHSPFLLRLLLAQDHFIS
jgi:hypothetical protein